MKFNGIQNIIVAVDLSKYSRVVARQAKEMAKNLKLPLIYIYVFEDTSIFEESHEISKKQVTKSYTNQVRKEYGLGNDDLVFIRYGRAYEEIIYFAKRYSQPLIVAGHKGQNLLMRFLLGSTAERLAQCSPFPVWIHRSQKTEMPRNILIPCDLSERTEQAIAQAEYFKHTMNAKFELFHVMKPPTPILDFEAYALIYREIKKSDETGLKKFRKAHPSLKVVSAEGGVVDKIVERAKSFDVIAIAPRNHRKDVIPFGSVTAKVIRNGETPILVMP